MKLDREKLIRARELLGYGIETTAEAAGVSKNSVLRAEHEEDIRPVTARKIAAALEVEVRDLLPLGQAPPRLEEHDEAVETWRAATDAELDALYEELLDEADRLRRAGKKNRPEFGLTMARILKVFNERQARDRSRALA